MFVSKVLLNLFRQQKGPESAGKFEGNVATNTPEDPGTCQEVGNFTRVFFELVGRVFRGSFAEICSDLRRFGPMLEINTYVLWRFADNFEKSQNPQEGNK